MMNSFGEMTTDCFVNAVHLVINNDQNGFFAVTGYVAVT